jgi:hypothetical protein
MIKPVMKHVMLLSDNKTIFPPSIVYDMASYYDPKQDPSPVYKIGDMASYYISAYSDWIDNNDSEKYEYSKKEIKGFTDNRDKWKHVANEYGGVLMVIDIDMDEL